MVLPRQPERAMLLKQSEVVPEAFQILRSDSFYRQRLLFITHGGIEVPCFGVGRGECVDHIFVVPTHDPARGRCVLNCVPPIAKCWVGTGGANPSAVDQYSGQARSAGPNRINVLYFL